MKPDVQIRPATADDIDQIVPFLSETLRNGQDGDRFDKLLRYRATDYAPNLGFVAELNRRPVGFLGAVYARRLIAGRTETFCNMTCWSVHPEHRKYSLKLLQALLAQGDYTYTNFTASLPVRNLLRFFKFDRLDEGKYIVSPLIGLQAPFTRGRTEVLTDPIQFASKLADDEKMLVRDHIKSGCVALLLRRGERQCLVVALKRTIGRILCADVLYASDRCLLEESFWPIVIAIWRNLGTPCLAVDRRFVGVRPFGAWCSERTTFFKSSNLSADQIDSLYSELVPWFGGRA